MDTNFSSEFGTTQQVKILGNTAVAVENFEGQNEAVEAVEAVEAIEAFGVEPRAWLKPEQYEFDFEEAARFLAVFGEAITFQIFAAKKHEVKEKRLYADHFHGTFEQYKHALAACNKRGYDIFFMVNEGDGKGRSDENVIRVRAVYIDLDGSPLEPVLACGLKPHIIVNTSPSRYHAFWLVSDMAISDFTPVQKAIIQRFNGDKSIKDPCRVMRIPGFYHQKKEPFRSFIYRIDPEMEPYTADQVKAEFGMFKDEAPRKAGARLNAQNLTRREPSPNRLARRSDAIGSLSAGYMSESRREGHGTGLGAVPSDYPAASFAKALSRCSFLKHCVDDAATLSEAEWYACCSNVARCKEGEVDGSYIFHEISEPHPEYSVDETDRKIEHALSDTGPHTCSHIAGDIGFEGCSSCEWAKYGTAPIQLGTDRFDNPLLRAMEEINTCHACVKIGGQVRILHENTDSSGRRVVDVMRQEDFHALYANRFVTMPSSDGKKIETFTVSKEWFKWKYRRQYMGMDFTPGKDVPGFYNLYLGMQVEGREGDWSLMKDHIREVIANGDERIFKYLLDTMARIVQDPGGDRPGVAIVMKGGQGTGKGIFVKNFGQLWHRQHYLPLTQSEQVVGKFNQHLSSALVVFVDEGFWAGDKAAEGVLKALITEETVMLEGKGRDAFQIQNHMNFFMASNNDWVVPAGAGERRFLVLDVPSTRKGDFAYFKALQKQMDNGGREAMLYDLLRRDISEANLRDFPRTAALADQVLRTLDSAGRFWHDKLMQGRIYGPMGSEQYRDDMDYFEDWPDWVSTTRLHEEYLQYCKANGIRHTQGSDQLVKKLKDFCPGIAKERKRVGNGSRAYGHVIPELSECRKAFTMALNVEIAWGDDEDEGLEDQLGIGKQNMIQEQEVRGKEAA